MTILRLFLAGALATVAGAQDCTPELTSSHSPRGEFGAGLAAQGDLLVVTAPFADFPPSVSTAYPYGRAELFEYRPQQTAWRRLDVLGPSPSPLTVVNNEGFGSSVAIGNRTLFFGWPADITGGNGTVRPFRRSTPAVGWIEEDPIRPPFQSATGQFGISVAAFGDVVVVGERLSDGMAHVYARTAITGGWSHLQTLLAPPPGSLTGTFGQSVAMHGDWIFVGAPGYRQALSGTGAVYVYRRTPSGQWAFTQRLTAVNSNPLANEGFGTSLDAEPGRLFVGSEREATSHGLSSGVAYVFELTNSGTWQRTQILEPPAGAGGTSFGASIDSFGDALMVGAPQGGTFGVNGFAFLFERDPVANDWSLSGRYTTNASIPNNSRAGTSVAVGDWHAALGAPGGERVRATPAFPTRNVDADNILDSCEALHDPTPCPALPNASGQVGRIHVDGTLDVTAFGTHLHADRLTRNSFGYFIVSRQFQVQTPPIGTTNGVLCLGGPIGRYVGNVLDSGPSGRVSMTVDPLNIPQPTGFVAAQPGETWYFEYWHRDDISISQRATAFTETARVTFE